MIEDTDSTIERIYNLALLAEKMVSRSLPLTSAATVQSTKTCFYCGQGGHVLKECTQKRRNKKPCQKYIESGIARFGPNYEWDSTKLRQNKNKETVSPHLVLLQQEESSTASILATQTINTNRLVVMILTHIKILEN